ncbi:MAG TPA: hypothetical protein VF668_24010, partial [Pyrinomonadaceae bacterium]
MRHQAVRTIALMLGVLLAAATPAQAGSITYGELARTVGAGGQLRPASEVRLRFGARGVAGQEQQTGTAQSGGAASSSSDQQAAGQQPQPASADPTLSQSGGRVETVDLGDVTGTVCDCGEIPPVDIPKAAAGFPWWTLAGIPLICVSGICTRDDTEPPTNPPTDVPPQVPEPMSL